MSGIEKTGNWDAFAKMLNEAGAKFKANVKQATNTNGRLLERTIVDMLQNDQVTPKTSEAFRNWKEEHGYSNQTLKMSGDMLNAVKYDAKSWNEGFVGVNRNAEGKAKGKQTVNLASLAAVHEYGRIDGSIPARPFLAPSRAKVEREMVENYQKAVDETFKK